MATGIGCIHKSNILEARKHGTENNAINLESSSPYLMLTILM